MSDMTDADWAAIGMKPPPKRVVALTDAERLAARAQVAPVAAGQTGSTTARTLGNSRLLTDALARRLREAGAE